MNAAGKGGETEYSLNEAVPLIQMDGKDKSVHSHSHMGAVLGH